MPIVAKDLVKRFEQEGRNIIDHVSLTLNDGEFVSLIGRSGSGKSTLLYLLSSLDGPSEGTVTLDGHDVNRLGVQEIHVLRNLKIGFVFQFHHLIPELTALENVLMPARKAKLDRQKRSQAESLLDSFGLADKIHRLPAQLSGGEQQRVAVARALIMNPRYLFADEPTGNLDTANGNRVMEIFQELNKNNGTTIVLVTHDPGFAARARREIHLVDGRVVRS